MPADADTAARQASGSSASTLHSYTAPPLAGLAGSRRPDGPAIHWTPLHAGGGRVSPPPAPTLTLAAPLRATLASTARRGAPDLVVRLLQVRAGCEVVEEQVRAHDFSGWAATAAGLLVLRLAADGRGGAAALRALAAAGGVRAALPRRARVKLRSSLRAAPGAVAAAVDAGVDWVDCVAPPAFVLAVAGAALSVFHPPSATLLRAITTAIPVACGYAATARDVASGACGDRGGGRVEAAWRARHRWAALKVAPHLGDLPETPPLAGLVSALEGLGGGCGGDGALWLSFPLPGGRSNGGPARRSRGSVEEEEEVGGTGGVVYGTGCAPDPLDPCPAASAWQVVGDDGAGDEGDEGDGDGSSRSSSAGPPGSLASALAAKPPPHRGLVLYGRANHAGVAAAEGSRPCGGALDPADALSLALRAATLLALFAPFALLAPLLLTLAALADRLRAPPALAASATAAAWALLLAAIRAAGPAFIKWGQWAAVRGDLFPPSLAAALAGLHDAAPVHAWADTRAALERAFGGPAGVAARFAAVDRTPLASGSVAQVHRASMRTGAGGKGGGATVPVALKVRHPGVARRLAADFALLKPLAAWAEAHAPGLRGLPLSTSLAQFTATMTAQADLRVEAAHLVRFAADLGRRGGGGGLSTAAPVTAPRPIPGLPPTPGVLAETFEPGRSVAAFMSGAGGGKDAGGTAVDTRWNPQIVALGVSAYLGMLADSFVHTDLHPGNILVRPLADGAGKSDPQRADAPATPAVPRLQIVLLDLGLAEELTPAVRRTFVSLLAAIGAGDGARAARHVLAMADNQTCADPAGFEAALATLFRSAADIRSLGGVDLDAVLKGVLAAARQHGVAIDSRYASLVVGVCVLAAFAAALDSGGLSVMDAAAPSLFGFGLTGRMGGRLCV